MTPQRMRELDENPHERLSYDEMAEGWHFCPRNYFNLVGPGKPCDDCDCFPDDADLADLL